MIGGGFHLEDKARPLPRQDVDEVGGWQEANLPTLATPDHHFGNVRHKCDWRPQPPPVLVSRVKQVKPASRSEQIENQATQFLLLAKRIRIRMPWNIKFCRILWEAF